MSLTHMFRSRNTAAATHSAGAFLWPEDSEPQGPWTRGLAWVVTHALMVIGLACALASSTF